RLPEIGQRFPGEAVLLEQHAEFEVGDVIVGVDRKLGAIGFYRVRSIARFVPGLPDEGIGHRKLRVEREGALEFSNRVGEARAAPGDTPRWPPHNVPAPRAQRRDWSGLRATGVKSSAPRDTCRPRPRVARRGAV